MMKYSRTQMSIIQLHCNWVIGGEVERVPDHESYWIHGALRKDPLDGVGYLLVDHHDRGSEIIQCQPD